MALLLQICTSTSLTSPPYTRFTPRVHFTPRCYLSKPAHDIAAAIWDDRSSLWHVFAGCWSEGGWQHLVSADLLAWTPLGTPSAFGGTGGLVFDSTNSSRDDEPRQLVAYASTLSTWLGSGANFTTWAAQGRQFDGTGNDPILWHDARDGRWYAATAARPGYGLEDYWSSPALTGPTVSWEHLASPLLVNHNLSLPRVAPLPQTREFVSPDFFPLQRGGFAGKGAAGHDEDWVFLTSTYGRPYDGASSFYNFANFFVGQRPAPGGPFTPRTFGSALFPNTPSSNSGVFDWSCFYPTNSTSASSSQAGYDLELATANGLTQFGCCPKTAAQGSRRVMFGWLQNGGSNDEPSRAGIASSNNTMTLPRELTLAPDGVTMLQAFVPELRRLRRAHFSATAVAAPAGGVGAAQFFEGPAASGAQLEIRATFELTAARQAAAGTAAGGHFGLLVLAARGGSSGGGDGSAPSDERTVIGFDIARQLVFLDRTASGAAMDADVRAGPWPTAAAGAAFITVHAFVDHSVVSLIAANETAISAWVHPQGGASTGVALWADVDGVTLTSIDIWVLADSN